MPEHKPAINTQRKDVIAEIERRRHDVSIRLLSIYNYYRIFVGLALLVAFEQKAFSTKLGSNDMDVYWGVVVAYTVVNLATTLAHKFLPPSWVHHTNLSLGLIVYDIIALSVLMYASGGIGSGIAALILVTVVTGAIIVVGQRATLIAATASIAVLYEEFYLAISPTYAEYDFLQAGIFGGIYFAASISIQRLSNRMRANDIQSLTQSIELADLERLNRQIIQRMRTGIIVVDEDNLVRMHNHSARALIGHQGSDPLLVIPPTLTEVLTQWRSNTSLRARPFQVAANTPRIKVNFSSVRSEESTSDVTIFLEDTGEVQQQAQQLKLAELGRLSASIAHEVRNPLGAISHAAQLLNESDDLHVADQRLTDIIINHCHRMNGVVENVLEMSRRKTPEPLRVNLADHLSDFVRTFIEAKPEAVLSVEIDPESTDIRVDPVQLTQALTNLVDNGIRYSLENNQGATVTLAGGIDADLERPFLNIIDRGVGVEPNQVANLFQPFSTTAVSGTGLGLYLSRELCESNHAQLSYSKDKHGGSCFRILFAHPDRITA